MAGYSPLKITGMTTGLVQERENFLLPDDAYPILQNAYVWRERIKRKRGFSLLGRLQRNIGTTDGSGNATITLAPLPIQSGIASFTVGTNIFTDPGGSSPVTLLTTGPGTATLNRSTGVLTIVGSNTTTAVQYFPGLPVMGIRIRELQNSANNQTIFFDQNYAYIFNASNGIFQEFISGTTWNAGNEGLAGVDFFWSTNYWVSGTAQSPFGTSNSKLFWVTNNSGHAGVNSDPPRITDGAIWVNFFPSTWSQIDATNFLTNWLCNLPFRGRMVTFNTWEGVSAASSINYRQRIRWSTIGNPFIAYTAGPPAAGSWRDDIRGQGGFLDIPTSEDIVSVGFVRDNLVIYCERSTWQLRYTGRSIAPFQIEKVNSEIGAESTFAAIQFDTSLVSVGDKGILECDSYKAERIDIKIPDFVFQFNSANNGVARVQGIRDFPNRLAYWTIPLEGIYDGAIGTGNQIFPNIRLVYNYENDSWALFDDSLTALGNYQEQSGRTWLNTFIPWKEADFTWLDEPAGFPQILGGNQQGFIEILDNQTVNDVSLFITNITQGATCIITSPNHNLSTKLGIGFAGSVIGISGIPAGTPFSSLNGGIYGVVVTDSNTFTIYTYDAGTNTFSDEVTGAPGGTYVGGGLINIRDNFSIQSKKFNFLDEGQNIQLGYLDILMATSNPPIGIITGISNANPAEVTYTATNTPLYNGTLIVINGVQGMTQLNGNTYFITVIDSTHFTLNAVNSTNFGTYVAGGTFQYPGAISLNVYLDYNDIDVSNTYPKNIIDNGTSPGQPDTFFNSIIPTSSSTLNAVEGTKFWQRVFCATRANFLTLEYTFNNAQLAGQEQQLEVQIDAQILWIRKAGRMTQI